MYIPMIDLRLMVDSIPFLLTGLPYTIGISVLTFLIGNMLGIILTMLGMLPSKIVKGFVRFYISFLRGVPGLVLLFLLYFGLPYQLNALTAACICFSLTSSAFIAEIYRGSIATLPNAGIEIRNACGKIILRITRPKGKPNAYAASHCPASTPAIDPR